ncbi:hypothetical protein [Pseudorhodoplanes sp.]|uniref:hypothetical protein n=1 Tax=Pseudorhodoplanes sp. TaxID=1934341 RepID=UPI00391B4ABB
MTARQAQWPAIRSLIDWFKPSPYQRDLDFLEKARGEEMDRLRAHVRGRPEDLRWLVGREPGSTELLCHMMALTGVDERRLPKGTMRELESNCASCTAKLHCADEIGYGRAAQSFADYCPNAPVLKRLQT